jgi:hypothetical protein
MVNYAIKYRPGAGGEFILCMVEGLRQGIIVEPDENNRYVGSHVDSWHQNMYNYFDKTGLQKSTKPVFTELQKLDKHCMTFHLWTLDYIVQLAKKSANVLVVEDSTLHSDILAWYKIPSYNKGSIKNQIVQIDRHKIWSQVYSDSDSVMNYAKQSLNLRVVEHDTFYNSTFEELQEILRWLADIELTKEWYEIFINNTATNRDIINRYEEEFIKHSGEYNA